MKKTVLVTLACLATLVFSGCVYFSNLQKNSWLKYESNRLGFTVEYPEDWTAVIEDHYGVTFSNTPLNRWAHGLGVPTEDGSMWIDVNIQISRKCNSHDYKPIFDEPEPVGIAKAQEKIICRDGFIVVLGFNPKSDDPNLEKKVLEHILKTFQSKPRK